MSLLAEDAWLSVSQFLDRWNSTTGLVSALRIGVTHAVSPSVSKQYKLPIKHWCCARRLAPLPLCDRIIKITDKAWLGWPKMLGLAFHNF